MHKYFPNKLFLAYLLLIIFQFFPTTAQAQEKGTFSLYPIAAYTDTGLLIGGYQSYQSSSERLRLENYLAFASDGFEAKTKTTSLSLNEQNTLDISLLYSSLRQYYFGLGNNTPLSSKKELYGTRINCELGWRHYFSDQVSTALTYLYNVRTEDKAKNNNITYVTNEANSALKLDLCFDERKDLENTAAKYVNATLAYYPSWANTLGSQVDDIIKVKLDLRYFQPIANNTLALRTVIGQLSGGRTSYLEQFKLGSDTLLRGVLSNRYVGNSLFVVQTEYRFPLVQGLIASFFVGAGRVGDALAFSDLHITKGFGLHTPIEGDKHSFRFNLAFSEDSTVFYANYGHAF